MVGKKMPILKLKYKTIQVTWKLKTETESHTDNNVLVKKAIACS